MYFQNPLRLDRAALARALGYVTSEPDEQAAPLLCTAAAEVEAAASPRWSWRRLALEERPLPAGLGEVLVGRDIAGHLAGCHACLLMAVTLGDGPDRLLRSAKARDISLAVALDAAASVLAEQYAAEAARLLGREAVGENERINGRFSPGFGDFPLTVQGGVLALLDAPRRLGLTANAAGALLPTKSATAAVGVAWALPPAGDGRRQ